MSLFSLGGAFNRFFRNQLNDKIREMDETTTGLNKRIDNIVGSTGDDITEIVDARLDEKGVLHPTIKKRMDTIGEFTTSEIENLKKENADLVDHISATGIPTNALGPTFTRVATRSYKGRTFAVNEPVYDLGGILVDPTTQESLTIPTTNIINSAQGTIEIAIVPFTLTDGMHFCRIDYASSGRFVLAVNASGAVSFSIGETTETPISTATNTAVVKEQFTAALRWNDKAKAYSLFVNGKKIGTRYYNAATKGEFGSSMSLVYNYPAVVTKLRISHVARADRELIY